MLVAHGPVGVVGGERLLGQDVEAGEQAEGLVAVEVVDMTAAFLVEQLQRQQRQQGAGGGDHLRAGIPGLGDEAIEAEPGQEGQEEEDARDARAERAAGRRGSARGQSATSGVFGARAALARRRPRGAVRGRRGEKGGRDAAATIGPEAAGHRLQRRELVAEPLGDRSSGSPSTKTARRASYWRWKVCWGSRKNWLVVAPVHDAGSRTVDYFPARNRRGAYPQNRGRTRVDAASWLASDLENAGRKPPEASRQSGFCECRYEADRAVLGRENNQGSGHRNEEIPGKSEAPDPRKLDYFPGRGNRRERVSKSRRHGLAPLLRGLGPLALGHDLRHRLGAPLERMSHLIPLRDERLQPLRQRRLVGEIGDPQPLPLQDAEPLLDLIHPRAMHRRVMEHEPRVLRQPRLDLLALVHPQVVQDDMDRLDRRGDLPVQLLQERDELGLPLPLGGHPVDLAGPRVERGEQVQGPAPPVLVLDADRSLGLGRPGSATCGAAAASWSSRRRRAPPRRRAAAGCRGRQISRTAAANAASRGTLGESQR